MGSDQEKVEEGRRTRKQMPNRLLMEEIMHLQGEFRVIDGIGCCKVYFLNGTPFTFDEDVVPGNVKEVLNAEEKPHFTNEDIYRGSSYLLEEGFELEPLIEEMNEAIDTEHQD